MALLSYTDGKELWSQSGQGDITAVANLDSGIVRLIESKEAGSPVVTIQTLEPDTGQVRWTSKSQGMIVGNLAQEENVLLFTTSSEVVGLDIRTGTRVFQTAFSDVFQAGSPLSASGLTQSDMLRTSSDMLYVSRELAGVAAYRLPTGKFLWSHENYHYENYARGATPARPVRAGGLPIQIAPSSASNLSSSVNYSARAAQMHYEAASHRADQVLTSRTSTKMERQTALERKYSAAQGNLFATQAQIAAQRENQRMEATGALLSSLTMGLMAAVSHSIAVGRASREQMILQHALHQYQLSFQGRYHVRPFKTEGRGVTIIDLLTGKRCDLVFSPGFTYTGTGLGGAAEHARVLELPTFAVDQSGKWLLTVDIGLNPDRYEEYLSPGGAIVPRSSVLAYDLSTLPFTETMPK
jgi:hypothetical protein